MGAEKPKSTASQVATPTRVSVNAGGPTATKLIGSNVLRNAVSVTNEDASNGICVGYTNAVTYSGNLTPGANDGQIIPPGECYEWRHYTGALYGSWDGSHAVTVSVTEE